MQLHENVLGDLGLMRSGCSSKFIEIDIKPFIYLSMNGVILITNLLRSQFFLQSFHFSSGSLIN